MFVWGDRDISTRALVEFYRLLGGGLRDGGWTHEGMSRNRLAILPDLRRTTTASAPPALVPTVLPFLDGETDGNGRAGGEGRPGGVRPQG